MLRFKVFIKNFLAGIGVTSAFVTILWSLWSEELSALIKGNELCLIFVIVGVNLAVSLYSVKTKKKLSIKLMTQVKSHIYYGDLFDNKGIIVIPVNEYFDTIVDEKIISSNTLHGYFIKNYFGGNNKELKQQINNSLSNIPPLEKDSNRKKGNKNRYPLGTVAQVNKGENIFYLVALTRFNGNNRAEVKKSEYQRVLCDLFDYIEQNSQGEKVSIPLIGGGHSGVDLSKQKLLEFLLFSISLNDKLTLINGINIILHSSLENDIDLNRIYYHYIMGA